MKLLLALILFPVLSLAQIKHELLTKIAVFPIAEIDAKTTDEAWWQMRENLSTDQRFYVANRRFMVNRGVFQARKDLKPSDVIILGKILEAQALISTYFSDGTLKMVVYESENGSKLWEGEQEFNSILPLSDQLVRISSNLIKAFVASIPYHSFQIIDKEVGKPIFENEGKSYAKIYKTSRQEINVGDPVQWVEVTGDLGQPLFASHTLVTIIAEGKVSVVDEESATVEIEKMRSEEDFKQNALIRLPNEWNRLSQAEAEVTSSKPKDAVLSNEYLSAEIRNAKEFKKDNNKTSSIMSWIVSLAGFILLAF